MRKQLAAGYHHSPGYNMINDGKIYVGIIKQNNDVQKMGRLGVYIPEFGGESQDPSKWFIVSYASPFAGVSNISESVDGSQNMDGTQTSYGLWMIPPDLNNQVLVVFINGEPSKGVWFACLYQQNMNHMIPGIASDQSYQEGFQGILPPVTEYNKKDQSVSPSTPRRPRFDPLHNGLLAQGLYSDFERGPTDASARRESPSKVFGLNSPRGSHFYIDDDESNECIRIRTRSGTQILLHETNGYVYINSGKGNSWLEISDDGIDMYSAGNISIRSEKDVNIRADKNINLDCGLDLNTKATNDILVLAGNGLHLSAVNAIYNSTATHNIKADTIYRDGMTYDNVGSATPATAPKTFTRADRTGSMNVTLSRMPTHEPFAEHPRSANLTPPIGDVPGQTSNIIGLGDQMTDLPPGPTITATTTAPQRTGEGEVKEVEYNANTANTAPKIQVGAHKVSEAVIAAIRRACEITSIDYGFMMAMCEKESSFNPSAIPIDKTTGKPLSSAKGLYQIIDKTWRVLYRNYGTKYNIPDDRFDPFANALMAAFLTKENTSALRRYGVNSPTATHLYMAHFMGPYPASTVILGDPNALGATVAGPDAAAANKWVFYVKGVPRTAAQIIAYFQNFMEPRAIAYRDTKPTTV